MGLCWKEVKRIKLDEQKRAGHVMCFLNEKLFILGGLSVDGLTNDVEVFDLETSEYKTICSLSKPRYEHFGFISGANELKIFGGSSGDHNLNDVSKINVVTAKVEQIETSDESKPSPRTCQSCAILGDSILVFGGGDKFTKPVSDSNVYKYNMLENKWSIFPVTGVTPVVRQGHIFVNGCNEVFLHGGLSNNLLLDDLHILNSNEKWEEIECCDPKPCARAAHGGVFWKTNLYVFGGIGVNGALNDFWTFNSEIKTWTEIKCSHLPSPRLDFSMIVIRSHKLQAYIAPEEHLSTEDMQDKSTINKHRTFILIHGGLNTDKELLADIHSYCLEN